jgi:transcriptional regulator with XRE-family HTH domain
MALATFLRARRARLRPEQGPELGGAVNRRRRAQGLRREEVALSAGISVAWYTALEQGRQLGVSANTLSRLATSLQLNSDERQYMFTLAGVGPSAPDDESAGCQYGTALLRAFGKLPSYVYDYMWNVCDWNLAADMIYGLSELPTAERNGLVYMFLNPRAQKLIVNWEVEARRMLAKFRLSIGARLGDPEIDKLVDRLSASPEFANWWTTSDDVLAERPQRKELDHPVAGALVFEYLTCYVYDDRSFRVVVHTPTDAATSARLETLLRHADPTDLGSRSTIALADQRRSPHILANPSARRHRLG